MAKPEIVKNAETAEKKAHKRGKALVLPSYSLKKIAEGDSIFIRIDSEMVVKAQMGKDGKQEMDGDQPKTITVMKVTDLDSGEQGEMVCPYMVHKALTEAGEYVGKSFEMVKGAKKGRTNEWATYELEA